MAPTVVNKTNTSTCMAIPSKLDRRLAKPNIIDIRKDKTEHYMHDEIMKGLQADGGRDRTLPTMLLYDKRGLQLFEAITFLDEVTIYLNKYPIRLICAS